MLRTQIYLTENERSSLIELAAASGKSQSELIREAVDRLTAQFGKTRRREVIDNAAGMWKHRKDIPDFREIRQLWDRS